jgi:hypothetical protein
VLDEVKEQYLQLTMTVVTCSHDAAVGLVTKLVKILAKNIDGMLIYHHESVADL